MKREIFVLDWLIWQRKAKTIESWKAKKVKKEKGNSVSKKNLVSEKNGQ